MLLVSMLMVGELVVSMLMVGVLVVRMLLVAGSVHNSSAAVPKL